MSNGFFEEPFDHTCTGKTNYSSRADWLIIAEAFGVAESGEGPEDIEPVRLIKWSDALEQNGEDREYRIIKLSRNISDQRKSGKAYERPVSKRSNYSHGIIEINGERTHMPQLRHSDLAKVIQVFVDSLRGLDFNSPDKISGDVARRIKKLQSRSWSSSDFERFSAREKDKLRMLKEGLDDINDKILEVFVDIESPVDLTGSFLHHVTSYVKTSNEKMTQEEFVQHLTPKLLRTLEAGKKARQTKVKNREPKKTVWNESKQAFAKHVIREYKKLPPDKSPPSREAFTKELFAKYEFNVDKSWTYEKCSELVRKYGASIPQKM